MTVWNALFTDITGTYVGSSGGIVYLLDCYIDRHVKASTSIVNTTYDKSKTSVT